MNRREFLKNGSAAATAAFAGCATPSITGSSARLAILGGTPVVAEADRAALKATTKWPIVNDAMRRANDRVLCDGAMSGWNITDEFERKFAEWNGTKYASSAPNGTMSLWAAFYAVGLGPGDELICPSVTYWASCLGAIHLGASVVFCDVKAEDLTVDPASFEAHITPRTKAIVVVHLYGSPCDMDAIMAIARKHNLKVIEDVSHAQGGFYKGRKLGTIGDVGAMSLMSGKSFAIGEGGMLVTDDYEIYRRVIRWGSYERIGRVWKSEETAATRIVPLGGVKNRLNQCCAAIGLEQLKKYDGEIAAIEKSYLAFHEGIGDIPGITKMYPKWEKSTKAGWYASFASYDAAKMKGVSSYQFAEAFAAETGMYLSTRANFPLHTSSVFADEDIFGKGGATFNRFRGGDPTPDKVTGRLPIAESRDGRVLAEPLFRYWDPRLVDTYVEAFHKVYANLDELGKRPVKEPDPSVPFGWSKKEIKG